jgi:hypothetical protein
MIGGCMGINAGLILSPRSSDSLVTNMEKKEIAIGKIGWEIEQPLNSVVALMVNLLIKG